MDICDFYAHREEKNLLTLNYIDYKFYSCMGFNWLNPYFVWCDYLEIRRVHNLFCRKSRAKDRISYIINDYKYKYFMTFTFNDKYINFIDSGLACIKRNLRALNCCFIGNIDYGSKNNRVHYHFIVGCDLPIFKKNINYKYGFYDIKPIISNNLVNNYSDYLLKLTNHHFKGDLQYNKLIYSRKRNRNSRNV